MQAGGGRTVSEQLYLGVDIGGTSCSVCVGSADATILDRTELATGLGPDGARRTIDGLAVAARRLAAHHPIVAAGISSGGPLDTVAGVILDPPNLAGWEGTPIVSLLEQATGVPTSLENDANAGALAEWRFGAGRGAASLVFLTFSTGMGAGLILGGRLHRGAGGVAGEVGHIRLADDGPSGYGKRGSFEGFCSGPGLARLVAAELGAGHGQLTGRDVVERARAGDAVALRAVTVSGERLGQGLALLIDVLNPEVIVVGGMGFRLGDLLLEPARRVAAAEAIPAAATACRIVPAALGERIGDVAAICVALEGQR
jgi:glucokinase